MRKFIQLALSFAIIIFRSRKLSAPYLVHGTSGYALEAHFLDLFKIFLGADAGSSLSQLRYELVDGIDLFLKSDA